MRSYSLNLPQSRLLHPSIRFNRPAINTFLSNHHSRSLLCFKLLGSRVQRYGHCSTKDRFVVLCTMDWDSVSSFSLDDRVDSDGSIGYAFSSSEGEESDGDIILNPITDVDIPTSSDRFHKPDDALTTTAYELRMIGKSQKRNRIKYGMIINIGLVTFLTVFLLLLDSHAWRIMIISKWPARHSYKKGTTTMGGLFLIPIGVGVAEVLVGFSSIEVAGASIATLAFATIGLVDDFLCLVKRRRIGLSQWVRILLEVAVGTSFYFWLCARNIASPYSMYTFLKMVVPLPLPLGLVCMGGSYVLLTSFCFVSMANGMELTDGLDGLAGGTAALAFIGMSIAVLPICSDLAVFGASMAGACVGFLFHNRYKASVFMGDTGTLALGGALAAMAASTGMFFPLLISSGVIVLEALSVLLQVSFSLIIYNLGFWICLRFVFIPI
ncbi:putative phospho-N-acetylmuramoyl-pentapeptide-transferase [Helianthus annuus]|nr:putative phospho-N-acetylmuramoyl-pentapeptide-transferase [Helianthus annuus]KAJ0783435.1 putative phospho-N-acetylmuramoyl-pentapeptide-transferase [Helianthus annuus]